MSDDPVLLGILEGGRPFTYAVAKARGREMIWRWEEGGRPNCGACDREIPTDADKNAVSSEWVDVGGHSVATADRGKALANHFLTHESEYADELWLRRREAYLETVLAATQPGADYRERLIERVQGELQFLRSRRDK